MAPNDHRPFAGVAGRRLLAALPLIVGGAVVAAAVVVPAMVAGFAGGLLVARPPDKSLRLRRLARRGRPLSDIRDIVLGRPKPAVAAAFGPPRTAFDTTLATGGAARPPGYMTADTWYYPLDPSTRTAVAIRFSNGLACEVDFFGTPAR